VENLARAEIVESGRGSPCLPALPQDVTALGSRAGAGSGGRRRGRRISERVGIDVMDADRDCGLVVTEPSFVERRSRVEPGLAFTAMINRFRALGRIFKPQGEQSPVMIGLLPQTMRPGTWRGLKSDFAGLVEDSGR